MRSVKVMLLGIGLILVGIFFRLWSIRRSALYWS